MQQVGVSPCTYILELIERCETRHRGSSTNPALLTKQACPRSSTLSDTKHGSVDQHLRTHAQENSLPTPTLRWAGDPPGAFCHPQPQGAQSGVPPARARRSHHAFGRLSLHMSACPCPAAAPSEDTIPASPLLAFSSAVTFSRGQPKPHRPSVPPIAGACSCRSGSTEAKSCMQQEQLRAPAQTGCQKHRKQPCRGRHEALGSGWGSTVSLQQSLAGLYTPHRAL